MKTLRVTPVEFAKINDAIYGFVNVNDPESDRHVALRAISDVVGDKRTKEVRDWLASGHDVKFEVVLE